MDTGPLPSPSPSWNECVDLLLRLPEMPLDARIEAAEVLMRNPSPGIRQQALRVGAAAFSDARLTDFLRADDDAVRRNAGAEIFRLRGSRSLPAVLSLLADPDPDVVLQAVHILSRLRDPRALEALHGILDHEDPNVVQEALLAIGQLGDSRSVSRLTPFLDADPWLQLAAIQALGDLRAKDAVPRLAEKLADPFFSLPAAEGLARIGGRRAFAVLAEDWLASGRDGEVLGLLTHVAEGLSETPETLPAGLTAALFRCLGDPSGAVQLASARCLLALGPSPSDEQALQVLAGEPGAATDLPPALGRRSDLVSSLLALPGKTCLWGLWLAARFPAASTTAAVVARIEDIPVDPEILSALAEAFVRGRRPGLGAPLLAFYLRLRPESRALLLPALESSAEEVRAELAAHPDMEPPEAIVLSATLGGSAETLRAELLALPAGDRAAVVGRLLGREDVIRSLPWAEWLASGGEDLAPLAAEAAARYRLTELLPALRRRAELAPTLPVLLALGELSDAEAIPLFLRLIEQQPGLRPVALECLGKIGDAAAHEVLRQTLATPAPRSPHLPDTTGADTRLAWRALARCAETRDEPLFRDAASHPDWYVRLVATEVLARSSFQPENLAALALLAADPVSAVAHRALRALES